MQHFRQRGVILHGVPFIDRLLRLILRDGFVLFAFRLFLYRILLRGAIELRERV